MPQKELDFAALFTEAKKSLEGKRAYEMGRYSLFLVDTHQQMVFTDIITFPCFMVSEKIKYILQKYDSFIQYIRVIFYDDKKGKSEAYYLPFLEKIEAYAEEGGNSIQKVILEPESLRDKVIFKIRKDSQIDIIVRLDLLESILRREVLGIGVEEINIGN